MDSSRTQYLIQRHFDAALTAAEKAEFEQLLLESADSRLLLWAAMQEHLLLRIAAQTAGSQSAGLLAIGDARGETGESVAIARRANGRNTPALPAPASPVSSSSGWRGLARDFAREPVLLGVLALSVISGLVLFIALSQTPERVTEKSPQPNAEKASRPNSVPPSSDVVAANPSAPALVARLTQSSQAVWAPASAVQAASDGQLASGTRLILESGVVEIDYATGARVIIQGPADYVTGRKKGTEKREESSGKGENPGAQGTRSNPELSIVNYPFSISNSGILSYGKLVANVPAAARGFTVETPTLRIVDLGTEFGVIVKANDPSPPAPSLQPPASSSTEVHVLTGTVTVAPLEASGASPLQVAQEPPMKLKSGEAVRSSAESPELKVTPAEAGKFVRQIPHSAPTNGLLGHWPLDGSFRAAVGSDGKHFDRDVFTPAVDRSGKADGAVMFKGNSAMSVDGGGGLAGLNEGTISLFVKWQGEQPKPGIPGAVFGRQMPHAGWLDAILALSGADPATAVLYWKARSECEPLQGRTPVGDEKWRHVAVTFGPGGQELYLDGTAEAHTKNMIPGGLHRAAVGDEPALTIGGITFDAASYARCALDDVKIFNRQLTAEEIKTLATAPAENVPAEVPPVKPVPTRGGARS